jgi:hypothetical protein
LPLTSVAGLRTPLASSNLDGVSMTRHVFFSFHYQQDIFRVNQIRSVPNIVGEAAAGFRDASLWEESKRRGDGAIHRLIDDALHGTSVTVVCIGSATAGRKFINYEISQSVARGNALMGLRINHLIGHNKSPDPPGQVPGLLLVHGAPIFTYTDAASLAAWIETMAQRAGR